MRASEQIIMVGGSDALGGASNPQLVIYGGAPAGLIAGIAAARQGVRVAVYEPTDFIGGMTTGGISRTDWRASSLSYRLMGAITAEFYQRAATVLGISAYDSIVQQWNFPCSVFRSVFTAMLAESGVTVRTGFRCTSVTKTGAKITKASFTHRTTGAVIASAASEFIDASYEGDLMVLAGVTYFVGREANATYSETVNGVRASVATTYTPVDGYVTPATPASGVLPNVISAEMPASGSADDNVQAYGLRLSMTNDATWRVAIPAPTSYNALNYEFLGRVIAQNEVTTPGVTTLDTIFLRTTVVGKAGEVRQDWNDKSLSLDVPNWPKNYPDGTWVTRDAIVAQYEEYTLGLFQFLLSDSRIPSSVKTDLANWGFISGEFDSRSGLSSQLYIRSGRRMRGRSVLTQSDITAPGAVADPIGYSVYTLDTHLCTLRQTSAAGLKSEGLTGQAVAKPAPVPGDCILPQAAECTNLQAIYCGSYTHVSYASLRIEPSMQTLGEASGLRAAYAVKNAAVSGDVPGTAIVSQLGIARQPANFLGITGTSNLADGATQSQAKGTITAAGAWTYFTSAFGFVNSGAFHDNGTAKGTKTMKFAFAAGALGGAGARTIYLNSPGATNASTNVQIDVKHAGGVATVTGVDMKAGDWIWKALGNWTFNDDGTEYVTIKNVGTTAATYVIANAVGWN